MIERYSTSEMKKIWSEEYKFKKWLEVEKTVAIVEGELGIIPKKDAEKIYKNAHFDIKRIYEIEEITHHDVIAFTTAVAEKLGSESRYLHYGLTSTDVVDTAQALRLKEANSLIENELMKFLEILKEKALKYKELPIVGRTHGIHAEPMTFGLKFLLWYDEMKRNLKRFKIASEEIQFGKISGPVGTFSNLPPIVEEKVCKRLGIKNAKISTQILQRDRHAFYLSILAVIAGTFDKIALEIRNLQRSEVREAEEPFKKGQKGSSAMPHKRNPIKCEQICGLSRVIRSYTQAAFEDQALWHERDISHSSVERVILPDATTLIHYLTKRISKIIDDLHIYPENMLKNLNLTKNLIFSSQLLLKLVSKGILREKAYLYIQRNAMKVYEEGKDFYSLLKMDKDIMDILTEEELEEVFNLNYYFKHIDTIYNRVLNSQ